MLINMTTQEHEALINILTTYLDGDKLTSCLIELNELADLNEN